MIPDPTKMRPEDEELDGLTDSEPTLTDVTEPETSRSVADYNMAMGIAIGVAVGAVIGVVRDDLAMWIAIGIAIGVVGGYLMSQARRSRS